MSIGFAQERQFQLNPTNNDFGNRVTLVSATLSFPCDVERDSTHGRQIMCYTRYGNRAWIVRLNNQTQWLWIDLLSFVVFLLCSLSVYIVLGDCYVSLPVPSSYALSDIKRQQELLRL